MTGEDNLNTLIRRGIAGNPEGLVINIPAEALSGKVCLKGRGRPRGLKHLVIRGLPDADGNLPRLYCREVRRAGNVPKDKFQSIPFNFTSDETFVLDSMEIDGYFHSVSIAPQLRRAVIVNSYLHHALGDGIANDNKRRGAPRTDIEVCGSEVAHSGSGNYRHNFYIHRGDGDYVTAFWLVDSFVHSSGGSGVKSIANENNFIGNHIETSVATDPTFSTMRSTMNIDVPACSNTLIDGNRLVFHNAADNGHYNIGIRNRASLNVQGCDEPPYGSEQFNDPAYWTNWQAITPPAMFTTTLRKNVLDAGPRRPHKAWAITSWGTRPIKSLGLGKQESLDVPVDGDGNMIWRERSRVVVDPNNTFIGYEPNNMFVSKADDRPGDVNIRSPEIYGPQDAEGRLVDFSYFEVLQ